MEIKIFFLFLMIVSVMFSLWLDYLARKRYFKKNLDIGSSYADARLRLALFFPKVYFQKKHLWRGYLLYILSELFIALALVALYFLIKLN